MTAAEELRRVLPDTELLLVGAEPYDFYNRMAITRLVSESASIDSLYLNRRDWAESRRVDFRRGVPATEIDRQNREVAIADGERLEYDKVIIATGRGRSSRRSKASARTGASFSGRSTTPSRSSSTSAARAAERP